MTSLTTPSSPYTTLFRTASFVDLIALFVCCLHFEPVTSSFRQFIFKVAQYTSRLVQSSARLIDRFRPSHIDPDVREGRRAVVIKVHRPCRCCVSFELEKSGTDFQW